MKVEIIKPFDGAEVGQVKNLPLDIARDLEANELVKLLEKAPVVNDEKPADPNKANTPGKKISTGPKANKELKNERRTK